jgi:predicted MPP superfamily phosphohydrolase
VLPQYPQIDAMFSGHTHGMQMGVRTEHFQWSPIEYIYNEWAGHYHQGPQQLYVNVGYGFLGFEGRVGILPEITIFELKTGTDPTLKTHSTT